MKFATVYTKVFIEPCAVLASTHAAIRTILLRHMAGLPTPPAAQPAAVSAPRYKNTIGGVECIKSFQQINDTAVITVSGILASHLSGMDIECGGGYPLEWIRSAVDEAAADATINHIILALDSPGGSSASVPELAAHIAALPKHTVAFSDSLMASAAYWLAAGCSEIWVTPSSLLGSIGVYIALLDQTVAMEMEGLKLELFKAGEHKAMGLPGNPLSDSDRRLLQDRVNKVYGWFTGFVKERRAASGAVADDTMQGQCFDGEEAVARHLADGTVSDLNELIAELQKLTPGDL